MKPTSKLKQLGARAPRFLGSASLTMALASMPLTAETGEAANPTQSSEVVELTDFVVRDAYLYSDQVNALKTPTPILDVPQSLSLISAEDIAERGFNSIEDVVAYTPGVNISQGEGHRDAVVFRGVRTTADFFVDGVRDDVQYYRPLYNAEQIEILRGPNALLFGRGGAGGILNRVTKKGKIGQDFVGYSLSVDTFGAYEAQLDGNVSLGESSAFRINAYVDGFENHRDFSDGDGFGVNPTLKFELSEKTTLDVSFEHLDYDRSIDRGIPTGANGEPVDAFNDIVFGDPDLNFSEFEANVVRASLQHRFSDTLKGNVTASYGDYDKLYQNFYASDYTPATNIVELDGYVDTTQRENFILSGNLVGEFETGDIEHTLLFGAEYIDSSSENDRFNPVWSIVQVPGEPDKQLFDVTKPLALRGGGGTNSNGNSVTVAFTNLNDDTSTDLEVYSFYIQDEVELMDQLTLVLGARFDSFDIDVTGTSNGTRKDEEFTPRAGIIFKPQENISVYASYSQTFLPQSGGQFASLGQVGFDPDEFINTEIGLKWDISRTFSFSAAAFDIEQDIVDEDPFSNPIRVDNEIQGFELQISGQALEDWTVVAGYSYLEGEIGGGSANSGNTPRELPENMFSIWNLYQLTDAFKIGLGAIYQDESFVNDSNSATLPDFVRVDAAAYYTINEDLRLQVNIENLLDETYYPSAHSTHQATVGAPINARVAISGRF